ncbi:MAG: bifunctional hydroxymethylpyrimidine kinase/phosphomethylpyrimidine kinase [Tissierellia bacterium]|nr:bifunctional hydroxymethylpyrimidine kinase/phosphomethylpyrimidine kinase [Tissierellia bacterium]
MRVTALTIAGSDCSGGAGIQADLKTMLANGVYGMSVITALTAQNTCGVKSIMESSPTFLKDQLDAVFEDIFPDSIKIGMVSSASLIEVIGDVLKEQEAKNIVVDPVMVSTSGAKLISEDAVDNLKKYLLPISKVVTPNIPEGEILSEMTITSTEEMETAAKIIGEKYNCSVLLKGGHRVNDANDFLWTKENSRWFYGSRIDNPNTHGTGCTLSSAIAAYLAKGNSLEESIEKAKDYLSQALSAMLDLGKCSGPMDHGYFIK